MIKWAAINRIQGYERLTKSKPDKLEDTDFFEKTFPRNAGLSAAT